MHYKRASRECKNRGRIWPAMGQKNDPMESRSGNPGLSRCTSACSTLMNERKLTWLNRLKALLQSVITLGTTTQLVMRSEEHTSELQSLMRISYAVFCLKKKNKKLTNITLMLQ